MKIKKLEYLCGPKDLVNDCLDVLIFLNDQYCTQNFYYVVTTPQFLSTLMKESKSEFVLPHHPYIIVSKLTDENIRTAIQAFIDAKDDLYWLKLYHISATLNIEDINEILYRKKKENIAVKAKINTEIDAESDINH